MPLDVCPICKKKDHVSAKHTLKCFEEYQKLKKLGN